MLKYIERSLNTSQRSEKRNKEVIFRLKILYIIQRKYVDLEVKDAEIHTKNIEIEALKSTVAKLQTVALDIPSKQVYNIIIIII